MAGVGALALAAQGPAHAGPVAGLWQTQDQIHVVVDKADPLARTAATFARPVPTSNAKLIERQSLGNLHFELPVTAGCGYTDRQHLVVCLDVDYAMAAVEQLRVLAFANDPVRVHAGSERALTAVMQLLNNAPRAQGDIETALATTCVGDCARRVTLEMQ